MQLKSYNRICVLIPKQFRQKNADFLFFAQQVQPRVY